MPAVQATLSTGFFWGTGWELTSCDTKNRPSLQRRVLNLGLENASETDKKMFLGKNRRTLNPSPRLVLETSMVHLLFEIALEYAKRDGAHPT
jgi:hypothetical protein